MGAVKTGLSVSTYTLDGNDHLADLQMADFLVDATMVDTQGLAATSQYAQVAKVSGKHNFEVLVDNTGPKRTGLDVSVWNPAGSSLLGELQSGTLKLSIPSVDGSGIADLPTYANVSGARRITLDTEALIPSSATLHAILVKMKTGTLSDRTLANVLLTLGSPLAFDLPMTMGNAKNSIVRDQGQSYSASFSLRGAPSTVPGSTTLWGVAFSGDALITLSCNTGHGIFDGTGVITDMSLSFANGGVTKASGTLDLQGQFTYT